MRMESNSVREPGIRTATGGGVFERRKTLTAAALMTQLSSGCKANEFGGIQSALRWMDIEADMRDARDGGRIVSDRRSSRWPQREALWSSMIATGAVANSEAVFDMSRSSRFLHIHRLKKVNARRVTSLSPSCFSSALHPFRIIRVTEREAASYRLRSLVQRFLRRADSRVSCVFKALLLASDGHLAGKSELSSDSPLSTDLANHETLQNHITFSGLILEDSCSQETNTCKGKHFSEVSYVPADWSQRGNFFL
ncbi:hypothetical protein AXG93_3506s1200 [Marchantia polymorpha subsp. ruderalis]|uniref:Uncharacterized protein n=1 Tax=Marchantia polymorpha subsp. ruderalis TaxID=1480154 RepID=A0A176VNQ4_MARPO|nr:hypothetical protein AXG93_3506s1200 [Marchantia polymorpha subsp. ruderalis]